MTDLKEAQRQILEIAPVLGRESVYILEALGRVLARDIEVVEDFPPTDISAMDGYAMRHESFLKVSAESPLLLRIIGESPAGRPYGGCVDNGEAVRIMTGGMVPSGADTVIRLEEASEEGDVVFCSHDPGRGDGIRLRGESMRKGDVVLRAGDIISPVEIGLLATLRRSFVPVHRRPLVAIFSTGDELTDFHEPPSPGKTMCSNLYTLAAQVLETGGVPLLLGIVPDDLEAQKAALCEALRADVVITSGGLSMGKYDLVKNAMVSSGMKTRFSNILVKPGKPMIFGTIGEKLVFGLPGNPSAAMLSFEHFIRPTFLKMMGHRNALDTVSGKSRWSEISEGCSLVDSFVQGHHPNNDGKQRASLVPMGKPSSLMATAGAIQGTRSLRFRSAR